MRQARSPSHALDTAPPSRRAGSQAHSMPKWRTGFPSSPLFVVAGVALAVCLATATPAAETAAANTAARSADDSAALPPELLAPTQVEPVTKEQFEKILEHHKGKVVLVNLWATWCIPCLQELPDIDLLQSRYRDRGLVVLAVSLDKAEKLEDPVRPFFAKTAPELVSYLAQGDDFEFVSALDPDWLGALPTSFFIDREGAVKVRHSGRLLYKELEEEILRLLGPEP